MPDTGSKIVCPSCGKSRFRIDTNKEMNFEKFMDNEVDFKEDGNEQHMEKVTTFECLECGSIFKQS